MQNTKVAEAVCSRIERAFYYRYHPLCDLFCLYVHLARTNRCDALGSTLHRFSLFSVSRLLFFRGRLIARVAEEDRYRFHRILKSGITKYFQWADFIDKPRILFQTVPVSSAILRQCCGLYFIVLKAASVHAPTAVFKAMLQSLFYNPQSGLSARADCIE